MDWRKAILLTHRWLGIAGCVLFTAWFFSGVVMMYARMPELAEEERLARAEPLDLSTATISPADATEIAGADLDRVVVGMLGGRPIYRFGGREQLIVYADDGRIFEGLTVDAARDVARRYAPQHAGPLRFDRTLEEPDQWTLQNRAELPMHRFMLDDAAGTHLYVSEVTGDLALRTTRRERFWAWLGPVTHWVYFTPLRRNGPVWSELIIWSSLIGCIMCVSGIVWGLMRYSPRRAFRVKGEPSQSPYTGLMKWHHYAGLIFGIVTLTWTYSGLLSMGPFNWFATPGLSAAQRNAATGGSLREEALTLDSMRAALAALQQSFAPKELHVMQFVGEPFWFADRPPAASEAGRWMNAGLLPRAAFPPLERGYVSAVHPERGARAGFDREAMSTIAHAAMPGVNIEDEIWLADYDGYYYDPRGSRALPVLRVRYGDPQATWLYLDPARGAIVQKSERVSRMRRWLYQGFHSLDFPFLYFKRPLWDIVVILLSIGGLVSSVTTLLPAWRRLRRHAVSLFRGVTSSVPGRAWKLQ